MSTARPPEGARTAAAGEGTPVSTAGPPQGARTAGEAEGTSATEQSRVRRARRRRPAYFGQLDPAVREHFATSVDLATFLEGAGSLTGDQRRLLLRQALVLLEQNYVHLPLKRAMHAVDPVQRVKLLLQAEDLATREPGRSDAQFHRQLTEIFMSVRDLHTNYLLPAPYNAMQAFLPFIVEDFFEAGIRRYLVSHVMPGFRHPSFVAGVEVLHWNGIPIDRAVLNNASRYAGSNADAYHARGLATLTSRVLRLTPPPDEAWVVVGYRNLEGKQAEVRLDWMVNPPMPAGGTADDAMEVADATALGIDLEQHLRQRMRKAMFAPQVVEAAAAACEKRDRLAAFGPLESKLPDVFEARAVHTPSGTFGYLRIRSFTPDPAVFVPEFIRLLAGVPQEGLIIDVRGNGGGVIMNGELILQLLTPQQIEPEPVQFVNSPLNLKICARNGPGSLVDLSPWVPSMQQALQTGASYSAAFPITDPTACNAVGQKYFGPVVLIVDGLCYSTTDIFAAGFQDHEIGPVLGTDGNTGAGGANVWTQQLLARLVPEAASVYEALPNGASMRVSMRRTLRVRRRAGTPLEDLGVNPDQRHDMTRADLTDRNVDLLHRASQMLAGMPRRRFATALEYLGGSEYTLTLDVEGMSRIDIYVDDRPVLSTDIASGRSSMILADLSPEARVVEVRGFDASRLAARARIETGVVRAAHAALRTTSV